MLIGELSRKSGLSRDTIRFYEKLGLIRLGRRQRRANNYKEYPPEALQRLLSINQFKSFGFTLGEIAEMLDLLEANLSPCRDMPEMLTGRIRQLEEQIAAMQRFRDRLGRALAACDGNCADLFFASGCLGPQITAHAKEGA